MTESFIGLNPGSGGEDLETLELSSGRHIQSIRQNPDRGGRLYVASSALISFAATANLRVFSINNPAASGMTLYLKYMYAWLYASAAATIIPIQLTRQSDVTTTGTTVTPARPDEVTPLGNLANLRSLPTAGTVSGGPVGRTIITPPTLSQIIDRVIHDSLFFPKRDIKVSADDGLLFACVGTPDADVRAIIDVIYEEV